MLPNFIPAAWLKPSAPSRDHLPIEGDAGDDLPDLYELIIL